MVSSGGCGDEENWREVLDCARRARETDRARGMRGLHGGAFQAAVPVVTGGLHGQSCVSQTVAVPSSRSAAPLTVRGEEIGHFL